MPELKIADGRMTLHYEDAGSGSAVMLVHGFPFNASLWQPQIQALAPSFRVLAPNMRGFGGSRLSPAPYTLARLADDLAAVLDAAHLDRAAVGGLSMGGYVAFEFFRRHSQRVAALILADTRPEPDSEEGKRDRYEMARRVRDQGVGAVTDELLPRLLHPEARERRPGVVATLRDMINAANPEAIAAALMAMAQRNDSRDLLERIDVPTLVVGGDADALTPPDDLRAWASRIRDARIAIIEDAGHVSNLEQPDAFNAAVLDFISGTGGRREGR